jgi:hypothetical protein
MADSSGSQKKELLGRKGLDFMAGPKSGHHSRRHLQEGQVVSRMGFRRKTVPLLDALQCFGDLRRRRAPRVQSAMVDITERKRAKLCRKAEQIRRSSTILRWIKVLLTPHLLHGSLHNRYYQELFPSRSGARNGRVEHLPVCAGGGGGESSEYSTRWSGPKSGFLDFL